MVGKMKILLALLLSTSALASNYWGGSGSGIAKYANLAAFPACTLGTDGAAAIALDTDTLYICNGATTSWIPVGGSSVVLSMGTLDGQSANANGAAIASNMLWMQSADATHPGLVNNTSQTFAGAKTFSTAIAAGSGGTGLNSSGSAGNVLISTGSGWASSPIPVPTPTLTFTSEVTGTGSNSIALTIANSVIVDSKVSASAAITRSKMASGTNYAILANNSSGVMSENAPITANSGVVSDANGQLLASVASATEFSYLSGVTSSIQTQLDSKQSSGNYVINLNSGDVKSGVGPTPITTIQPQAVTYAKFQNVAANSFLANTTGSPATVSEVTLTASQLAGMGSSGGPAAITLGTGLSMTGTTLNAASSSGIAVIVGDILASPGPTATATIQPGAVTNAKMANMADLTVKGNVSGGSAAPSDLSRTQLTALINLATSVLPGAVPTPTSTAGTTFLNDNLIFATPTAAPVSPQSEVWLYTANGYGSTNTKIRRYSTTGKSIGSNITCTDSATLGTTCTVNANGLYGITECAQFTPSGNHGISLNSNQLTTDINSITASARLAWTNEANADYGKCTTIVTNLNSGDVVRPHTNGATTGASVGIDEFRVIQISN